jgi:hypothetical protein
MVLHALWCCSQSVKNMQKKYAAYASHFSGPNQFECEAISIPPKLCDISAVIELNHNSHL